MSDGSRMFDGSGGIRIADTLVEPVGTSGEMLGFHFGLFQFRPLSAPAEWRHSPPGLLFPDSVRLWRNLVVGQLEISVGPSALPEVSGTFLFRGGLNGEVPLLWLLGILMDRYLPLSAHIPHDWLVISYFRSQFR